MSLHNIIAITFPKWLPKPLPDHCLGKIQSGALSVAQQECIKRLSTHLTMRYVWETLAHYNPDQQALIDFMEFVRLHPTIINPDDKSNQLTQSRQRQVMKQISDSSATLLADLELLDPATSAASDGIEVLISAIFTLEKKLAFQQNGPATIHLARLKDELKQINEDSGIVETIKLLQAASKLAMDTPFDHIPKKIGAKTAPRTKLIKELKYYVRKRFNKPLNQVIANTVITAMDLPADSLTEDQIRRA